MSYTSTHTGTDPVLGRFSLSTHLAEDGKATLVLQTGLGSPEAKTQAIEIPKGMLHKVYSGVQLLLNVERTRVGLGRIQDQEAEVEDDN